MPSVTVSDKGQVVIPAAIRRGLGIKPGTQLEFELEGSAIRVTLKHAIEPASIDAGYGMLRARRTGQARRLDEFDVAQSMKKPQKP